jgi:hypothetical protein
MRFATISFCLLFFCTVLFIGCTFTTSKPKEPVFNDVAKIQKELKGLVTAEYFNVVGQEITTNKKTRSELEATITNGQNIPSTADERSVFSYSVAKALKNNLKDTAQFDSYRVKLVKKDESGGVTKTISVEYVFSAKDL